MRVRDAIEADLPALIELMVDDELRRLRENAGPPLPQAYIDAFWAIDRDPNHRLLVGIDDAGRLIGTMQLSYLPGISHHGSWRGQIEAVRISKECRGQGLGEAMIAWGMDRCRERGCRIVQLTSNKTRQEAHRFYARLGFEATHEGFKKQL